MTRRLVIPPEIVADIQAIHACWRTNRPLAPNLFIDEFNYACEMLVGMPRVGRPYPNPDVPEARRVLLRATRYHVYYREHRDDVVLIAVWSGLRGTGPDLSRAP
jgi:plasmid stabilization system protein ParE